MSLAVSVILICVAFATATLSAVLGFGGGIILVGVLLLFLAPASANAVHAVVQLVSNTTRLAVFSKYIVWRIVAAYALGSTAGVVICGLVVLRIYHADNRPLLMIGLGLFVLIATFVPKAKKDMKVKRSAVDIKWWPLIGCVTGFLGPIIGATGPMTAPIFLRADLIKERLIATKAACQATLHLQKLVLFAVIGRELRLFDGVPISLVGALALSVVAGTFTGKHLLKKLSARVFVLIFRIALTSVGLKLLIWDGLRPLL